MGTSVRQYALLPIAIGILCLILIVEGLQMKKSVHPTVPNTVACPNPAMAEGWEKGHHELPSMQYELPSKAVPGGGGGGRAKSGVSNTNGHITDCKLDSMV